MSGVLSLIRGNNTANIEANPNQTINNVTCTLPKDGGTLLTEANLPTSLKNPYKLKINGQEYDGSAEKEIAVDSNPTQNSTALVKSGGVYAALNGKADSSELSNYYLKTDTVDKAKKATNATYAEEADSATYDIAGDQINLTYLKKNGGVMSGDLKMSDASIRTTKLQDGDKMLEYSELTKSSTQPYTGRNLIGAQGGSGANVQTIIRSGGDLIHRRGNDTEKEDAYILDSVNYSEKMKLYLGYDFFFRLANSTNRSSAVYLFSIDVSRIATNNDAALMFGIEYLVSNGPSVSSSQTLRLHLRNNQGSIGFLQYQRKIEFGDNSKLYVMLNATTKRVHLYGDMLYSYSQWVFYPYRTVYFYPKTDFPMVNDTGASSVTPVEIPSV